MKLRSWIVGGLIAGGVVFAMRGCLSKAPPDQRLAGRLATMCEIARDNVDTPERGVRTLGRYLVKHVDDVLGDWGATVSEIERIDDDAAHDARARLARDRLHRPLAGCDDDWMHFAEAVENDPAARQLVERATDRLGRTFEIILSSAGADSVDGRDLRPAGSAAEGRRGSIDLRELPRELERMLERMVDAI